MAATPYIWWRGKRFTPDMRDAIQAAEQRAGFMFNITQGGFNSGAGAVAASAGTHDGDGGDSSIRPTKAETATMIEALRWAGFAAWLRTTKKPMWGTRAQGFGSYHVHFVPNGWGRPSRGARLQADRYRQGRDGLASNRADIGPGHTSAYRNQRTPRTPSTPGLPPSGAEGPARPNEATPKPPPTPSPTPAPTGGLSMADIDKIMERLNDPNNGLPYLSLQIKATDQNLHNKTAKLAAQNSAIANGAFGRGAINARNADTAAIVQKVVTTALAQVPGVDMNKVAVTVKQAALQALDERDAVDADKVIAAIVGKLES